MEAKLQANGAQQIYFKVCSTFDSTPAGNIGPVVGNWALLFLIPLAFSWLIFRWRGEADELDLQLSLARGKVGQRHLAFAEGGDHLRGGADPERAALLLRARCAAR